MAKRALFQKASAYWRLMRFDKPIGIFLLLWPGLWALWLAGNGHPHLLQLSVIVLGTILMRAAGCVINDYADRNFDPHVARTKLRPIASGEVKPKEALILFVVLCLISLGLVFLLNPMTILLSIPGAFLAATYPFTKRFTQLPQAYLGIAFGWAIPMSFASELDSIPKEAWILYAATILWALIYDTMYAMVDREDDLKIGVKSTAILFGRWDREIIGCLQLTMLGLLFYAGHVKGLGLSYQLGLLAGAGFFIYQQALIFRRQGPQCFRAFLNNHWFGAVVFAGIFLDYWLRNTL